MQLKKIVPLALAAVMTTTTVAGAVNPIAGDRNPCVPRVYLCV